MTVKVLQLGLSVKEMKEVFDHIEQFLNIMEKCDPNAQKSLQPWIRIQRDRLLKQDKKQTII
jgi:hypothetical protein